MPSFLSVSPSSLRLELTEADVRHLCGAATFDRADALQRRGHVLSPTFDNSGIAATVRGLWRRLDRVRVAKGNPLQAECTCGTGGSCRHVGAVLLQWLRDRSSFADAASPARLRHQGKVALLAEDGAAPRRTPVSELEPLLQNLTAATLRDLGQQRGLSFPRSRGKGELVGLLAPALAAPESVDAALAGLEADERLALDAAYLAEGDQPGVAAAIGAIFRAMGGTRPVVPVGTLAERGLVFGTGSSVSYDVPRAVVERLTPLDERIALLATARIPDADVSRRPLTPRWLHEGSRYGIDELIAIAANALGGEGCASIHASAGHRWRPSAVEGWWARYAAIHLYDEVTLIELGDDLLLDELRAVSSLDQAVLHAFSPRLVAVEPGAVDAPVGELTRLGYAPRVVEDG